MRLDFVKMTKIGIILFIGTGIISVVADTIGHIKYLKKNIDIANERFDGIKDSFKNIEKGRAITMMEAVIEERGTSNG